MYVPLYGGVLVSLVYVARVWMAHIDRQQSHLVQPGPISTAVNCMAYVPVSWHPDMFLSEQCGSKIAVIFFCQCIKFLQR